MSTIAVRPTAATVGIGDHTRYSPRTDQMPAPMNSASGASFAIVTTVTSRAPTVTPRTFAAATVANSRASSALRATGAWSGAHRAPIDPANALATDAEANAAISEYSMPARNATNGPNATSTYAYSPPVNDTRLPAAAKQETISAINPAHTMYAIGAAAPSPPATNAGSTKMPAPIVTLTMLAVRSRTPMARTSPESGSAMSRLTLPQHLRRSAAQGTNLA